LLAGADGQARPCDGRDTATAAVSALAAAAGAWGVRVHDAAASRDAVAVAAAWQAGAAAPARWGRCAR
ncbi:MAG: dihydropteroate synthase, partial [Pseudonocardiales bacterium]|nr:dihydropteroate synthase [Pseudonocardiales bacterium]